MKGPYYQTIKQLYEAGKDSIPDEFIPSKQLIYSSPAALSFNSPGAAGFGVKRAGLAVPGSVMLLVAPGCCGRNTKLLSEVPGYEDRFFFLLMDESDIVNGAHLEKVPQAVSEIIDFLDERPSCVMICSTCVDALLGTDWERVCRKAEEKAEIPVRPCYMYALTREGRKPPMVLVRQSIYSMLEPQKRNSRTVNLLGYFSPIDDESEFYDIIRQTGIRKVNEISRCESFEEYKTMSKANFNIVLDAESRTAADDMEKRLGIPYIELRRLYQTDKIAGQYRSFGQVTGTEIDDAAFREKTEEKIRRFSEKHGSIDISIGEIVNADPFELALAMTKYGHRVREIYSGVSPADFVHIRHLAELSPDTRVYTNLSPTMMHYDCSESRADLTIGMDAAYYRPGCPNAAWNNERQPFGYEAVAGLFDSMEKELEAAR